MKLYIERLLKYYMIKHVHKGKTLIETSTPTFLYPTRRQEMQLLSHPRTRLFKTRKTHNYQFINIYNSLPDALKQFATMRTGVIKKQMREFLQGLDTVIIERLLADY